MLFYQLLNNIGFCEYGTKWSGISESYQINLQHRVKIKPVLPPPVVATDIDPMA